MMAKDAVKTETLKALIQEYSSACTIAGFHLMFKPTLSIYEKYLWIFVVIINILLGFYWSCVFYIDWQDNPVQTILETSTLDIKKVPFPSVTICPFGYNQEAIVEKMNDIYFNFTSNCMSEFEERIGITEENYGILFQNCTDTFYNEYYVKGQQFDNILKGYLGLLSKNPTFYINMIKMSATRSCFEDPRYLKYITGRVELNKSQIYNTKTDKQISGANFYYKNAAKIDALLSVLWDSVSPCFQSQEENKNTFFHQCVWNGRELPCAAIFTKSITSQGICCSFNKPMADKIYQESKYSRIVTQLEKTEIEKSLGRNQIPLWYFERNEPNSLSGIMMGLEMKIDLRNNLMGPFSVTTDFESLTALITQPSDFPLPDQKGIPIIPGHKNFISMSAISTDADENVRSLHPTTRNCLFEDENQYLKIHKKYSQLNCFMECALLQATIDMLQRPSYDLRPCTPWYFPSYSANYRICDPWESNDFLKHFQNVKYDLECSHCLPDCRHTLYKPKLSIEPIQNCDENNFGVAPLCNYKENLSFENFWGKQALNELDKEVIDQNNSFSDYHEMLSYFESSYLRNITTSLRTDNKFGFYLFSELEDTYESFQKDIIHLNVHFDKSTALQFKTQASLGWLEYFAKVSSVFGLFIGLSIVTTLEIVWLMIRILLVLIK